MATNGSTRRVRKPVTVYQDGAHMYASFGAHWRAGVASLIPFGILFFTTQPFGEAMMALTTGGYTIGPALVAAHATAWAAMSFGVLHVVRFSASKAVHYGAYAGAGAVALLTFSMLVLVIVRLIEADAVDFWNATRFQFFLWAAPLLGAIGSVIGRRFLARDISWTVWIERGPLPDVFDFVEGKRDKEDFQRM